MGVLRPLGRRLSRKGIRGTRRSDDGRKARRLFARQDVNGVAPMRTTCAGGCGQAASSHPACQLLDLRRFRRNHVVALVWLRTIRRPGGCVSCPETGCPARCDRRSRGSWCAFSGPGLSVSAPLALQRRSRAVHILQPGPEREPCRTVSAHHRRGRQSSPLAGAGRSSPQRCFRRVDQTVPVRRSARRCWRCMRSIRSSMLRARFSQRMLFSAFS